MTYNYVLLALAALVAVTAAIPYFPIAAKNGEYEPNEFFRNAPLNEKPANQAGGSEVESGIPDVESEVEAADQAASGGDSSGEDAAAAGAINAGDTSGAVAGAAGTGAMAGAGAPVVAEEKHAGDTSVYAAAGPAPGQLTANNSRGKGLGIAVGVCLLVVATTAVAVFAIRKYWRHRLFDAEEDDE